MPASFGAEDDRQSAREVPTGSRAAPRSLRRASRGASRLGRRDAVERHLKRPPDFVVYRSGIDRSAQELPEVATGQASHIRRDQISASRWRREQRVDRCDEISGEIAPPSQGRDVQFGARAVVDRIQPHRRCGGCKCSPDRHEDLIAHVATAQIQVDRSAACQ